MSLTALMAAFLLLFAACGGGDDDGDGVASIDDSGSDSDESDDSGGGGNGPSPEERAEMEDAMLEYVECMRGEGIDMPDPEFDDNGGGITMEGARPGSEDEAAMQAAEEKCSPILEEAAPSREMSPEQVAELQDQLVAVAECMRARGHQMEDPTVSENGMISIEAGGSAEGDTSGGPASGPDPEFEKDMEECNEEAGLDGGPMMGGTDEQEDD